MAKFNVKKCKKNRIFFVKMFQNFNFVNYYNIKI